MANIKSEISDDYHLTLADGIPSIIKQEIPVNLDDNLIKIEELPLDKLTEMNEIDFRKVSGENFPEEEWLFEQKSCDEKDPLKIKSTDYNFNPPLYRCDICDEELDTAMRLHIQTELRNSYKCNRCKVPGEVVIQKLTDRDKTEYKSSKFTGKSNFGSNKQTHGTDRQFECDLCERKFSRKPNLEVHMRIHTGVRPYECELCEKKFTIKRTLVLHRRTHTGDRPYKCDVCERKFSRKENLMVHQRMHTGDQPYKCDLCEQTFAKKISLGFHKRKHTGDRPHNCDLCQMRFLRKENLTAHKWTHTGDRPYKCDVCEKRFSRKDNLRTHKRTHAGFRPYECKLCEKKFALKKSLMSHSVVHSGERPYECDMCGKKFSRKYDLSTHKRLLHSNVDEVGDLQVSSQFSQGVWKIPHTVEQACEPSKHTEMIWLAPKCGQK